MERIYRMADIVMLLSTPFDYEEDERYKVFAWKIQKKEDIDFAIFLVPCEEFPDRQKFIIEVGENRYYQNENEIVEEYWEGIKKVPFRWLNIPNDWISHVGTQKWLCKYKSGKECAFRYTSLIFRHIGFNLMLNQKKALLLHCSFIKIQQTGVLFSGPSGIGKSTQAELWRSIEQAEIVNGDRAIIRKRENEWKAFGLPYAGSSNIFRNESAKIGAIVVLRQGSNNRVWRLPLGEAFRSILSEIFQNNWNTELQMIILEALDELVKAIPVFMLSCKADEESVKCLKTQLQVEGILL